LSFANGVHHFNTSDRTAGTPEGFKTEHGTREPFHRSMILLHNIIERLALADDNRGLLYLVVVRDRRCVAPTLIDGDLLRQALSSTLSTQAA
jgi:hypothetical protein